MAEKKKLNSANKKNEKRSPSRSSVKKPSAGRTAVPVRDRKIHQIMPFVLLALSVFVLVGLISPGLTGIIGKGLRTLIFGLFGSAGFAIPALMALTAVFWRKKLKEDKLVGFLICEVVFFLFLSLIIHHYSGGISSVNIKELFVQGGDLTGGGLFGGLLGILLYQTTGSVGTAIIGFIGLTLSGLAIFELTPYHVWLYASFRIHERREKMREEEERRAEEEKRYTEENERLNTEEKRRAKHLTILSPDESTPRLVIRDPIDKHHFEPDVLPPSDGKTGETVAAFGNTDGKDPVGKIDAGALGFETVLPQNSEKVSKLPDSVLPGAASENGSGKVDLSEIFTDPSGVDVLTRFAEEQQAKERERHDRLSGMSGAGPDGTPDTDLEAELKITREALGNGTSIMPFEKEPVREYVFPPISLLKFDPAPPAGNINEELHSNATKLVETLRSFKVRTRIVNVSRGPAITRYELAPEEGVRVRSIANLVDDIALNLATSGVRIEAPIPGKAAVGIEVPNKTVSTVFLRELIDTDTFAKATSKLNVSLGVDVAGDPVYFDIAKMPHLLIAGATGMGKSVCINSIIVSLLYKAKPEEVKLILVDPKKVEFSLYNGLPHLLVPVVSDPKKAAGSLQWAVSEMERRFELIEEVGVRDVKNYNSITKDDPEKEFLPQIVIIIDELADLMMTAPDDVETSICRLAQKARAAGMHLIIGTQRPSVDVITGLIKANVPSRIAFTVSSQTDSRVVLDISGAEKLIGRGDMLFAPVGAAKPRRVQGAFVSDFEVEQIVSFIKENNAGENTYSDEIMESIDRAAAACGTGKRGSAALAGDGEESPGDADPMMRRALELAIECGKISTSLIQRRLSLGYGRAAKLIDEMQIRGYVSPPDGQKPRSVLITKEQYMEMVLDRKEDL